jgi:hypothetical protein
VLKKIHSQKWNKTIIIPVDTQNYESVQEDRILLGFLGNGFSFTFLPSMALIAV